MPWSDDEDETNDETERPEICAFCGRGAADDPRRMDLALGYFGGVITQNYAAHFECVRAALHPDVRGTVIDLTAD